MLICANISMSMTKIVDFFYELMIFIIQPHWSRRGRHSKSQLSEIKSDKSFNNIFSFFSSKDCLLIAIRSFEKYFVDLAFFLSLLNFKGKAKSFRFYRQTN